MYFVLYECYMLGHSPVSRQWTFAQHLWYCTTCRHSALRNLRLVLVSLVQVKLKQKTIEHCFSWYTCSSCIWIQETHQEMRYPNVTSLYFSTPLVFNAPNGGVPLGHFVKFCIGGQRMAEVQNGKEIFPKVSTCWIGRTNVTDNIQICDSRDPNIT